MSALGFRSPFTGIPRESRRALFAFGVLSLARAIALVVIAWAVTSGVIAVIHGDDWRGAALVGLAAALAQGGIAWATTVVAERAAIGVKAGYRRQLAARYLARGGRDVDAGVGEIAVLATQGLDDLDAYFTQYLPALTRSMTIPPVVGLAILLTDWPSVVVILLTLPLIPVFMALIGHETEDRARGAADEVARLSNQLVELARGLTVLIGLGRAEAQTAQLRAVSERVRVRTMGTLRTAFLSSMALELIASISVAVVAVIIGLRLIGGEMSLADGLFVLVLAPECYLPFRQVGAAFHASEDGQEALARVRRLVATPHSRLPLEPADAAGIAVDSLTLRYAGRREPVLQHLSFTIAPGEMVAVSGPSGCGKSTLLATLAGLNGDGEEMRLTGTVRGVDPERIAWVPQHPATVADTVRDEVAFALEGEDAAVDAILERVGIAHLADRHPGVVSPGELRRLALARALARIRRGATLLLVDEPTAHLDATSARVIEARLRELSGTVTIVLVSHDPNVRAMADREIRLGADVGEVAVAPVADMAGEAPVTIPVPEAAEPPEIAGTWRVLAGVFDLRRWSVIRAVIFGVAAALSGVALSALSGWLIVRASEQPPILYLMAAIVGVRFFGLGRAVFRYAERLFLHDAIFGAITSIRVRVWRALAASGPSARHLLRGEEALDRLVGDTDRLRDLAPRVLVPPVVGGGLAVAVSAVLVWLLPGAGLLALGGSAMMLVAVPWLTQRLDRAASAGEQAARSRMLRRYAAVFSAAIDLRASGLDGTALAELGALEATASGLARRRVWARGVGEGMTVAISGVLAMAMLAVGASAVAAGAIPATVLAVLVLTPLALADPFVDVVDAVQQWPALRSVAGRLAPLLGAPVARDEPGAGVPAPGVIESIRLEHLAAGWPGQAAPVFAGVEAEGRRGEWLVLTGPSGSGKTTLLSVLLGFLRPREGRYLQNGIDTAGMRAATVREQIAWCPQEAHLFDSTLRANLLLARSPDDAPDDAEMRQALERVGLGPLFAELPDGLATRIGSQGAFLSGGQRQRVAIARALLTRSPVLLLDEPTAHLDRPSAAAMMDDLRASLGDTLVVMVTHRPEDIRPGDRRVHGGRFTGATRVKVA